MAFLSPVTHIPILNFHSSLDLLTTFLCLWLLFLDHLNSKNQLKGLLNHLPNPMETHNFIKYQILYRVYILPMRIFSQKLPHPEQVLTRLGSNPASPNFRIFYFFNFLFPFGIYFDLVPPPWLQVLILTYFYFYFLNFL